MLSKNYATDSGAAVHIEEHESRDVNDDPLAADQAVSLETIASIFVRPTLADGELWLFSIVGAKPGRQTYPTAGVCDDDLPLKCPPVAVF